MKNFALGLLIGGIITYAFFNKIEHSPIQHKENIETANHEIEIDREPLSVKKKPIKIVAKRIDLPSKPLKLYQKLETSKLIPKKVKPKKNLKINLSKFSVNSLENSWDELPEHASTERVDDGWKIRLKRKDNFFSRFGFKDGDVINYTSLESDDLTDGQAELMDRVIAILQHIEE